MRWTFLLLLLPCHFYLPAQGFGAEFLCSRIPGLSSKQREICQSAPDALAAIGEGTRLALSECEHQFRFSRWNCSVHSDQSFGHVVVVGSREAAFLYAIISSGVTYALTQACGRGNISSCGCAPPTTISTSAGKSEWGGVASGWRWGGCSADVDFAVKFTRRFLDSREVEGDGRSLMNLHNNKAGRKAVQTTLETECKCHGVSGSCTLKTCWLKLANFRRIGDNLIEKFRKAKQIFILKPKSSGMSKRESVIVRDTKEKPRRSELVFLQPSPNYCEVNGTVGSLGTQNRRCMKGSGGEESCDILCCGRGYNTHQIERSWKCQCKFRWCCDVECLQCFERAEVYTCN